MADSTEPAEEQAIQIQLQVTDTRLKGLKWSVYRKSNKDPEAMSAFVAHFMVDKALDQGGRYLTQEEAYAILDELTIEEVGAAMEAVYAAQDEAAVPNT